MVRSPGQSHESAEFRTRRSNRKILGVCKRTQTSSNAQHVSQIKSFAAIEVPLYSRHVFQSLGYSNNRKILERNAPVSPESRSNVRKHRRTQSPVLHRLRFILYAARSNQRILEKFRRIYESTNSRINSYFCRGSPFDKHCQTEILSTPEAFRDSRNCVYRVTRVRPCLCTL